MSDDVAEKTQREGRFVIGGKPGPGRPKGSRNKFANLFIDQFYGHWQELTAEGFDKGYDAIERLWKDRPGDYLRVAAGILPQKLEIERSDNLTSDERAARIRELIDQFPGLRAALGDQGSSGTGGVRAEAPRADEAIPLPTLQ